MRRFMAIAAFLAVATGLASAQSADDWFLGKKIRNIRFEGLVVVTEQDVDPIVIEFKDQVFSYELWDSMLSRVYELDLFDEISPEAVPADAARSAVIIVFKVRERPAVDIVRVEGNEGLRTAEILDVVTIKPDTIFNAGRLRLDEIAVRQLYQSKGFPEASVKSAYTILADGSVEVVLTVDEGTQMIVEAIAFEGVVATSETTLKGEMPLKEKGLFQPGHFSETALEQSRQAIETFYKRRGYVDARVADMKRETVTDEADGSRRLRIVFVVVEGRQYLFGGATFEGNAIFDTARLAALVKLKPGSILNVERLQQDLGRVADAYFEEGYIFNGFDLREERDEERGTIAYAFIVTEREQAHIEDIVFRGNYKTDEGVLRREMPLQPGDVFSKARLLEGLRNLYNLQYFAAITPEYEQGSGDLLVDLIINVEEQSTANVNFGVTLANLGANDGSFPLLGNVTWKDSNFRGMGQNLSIGVEVAADSQDLSFGFTENWLFGRRWSGGVELSFKHERLSATQDSVGPIFSYDDPGRVPDPYTSWAEYEAAGKTVPDEYLMNYDTWSASLALTTGYRFVTGIGDIGVGSGLVVSLENKTYDDAVYRPFDSIIAENLDAWLLSNTIYARGYLNGLDLWYDPSNGYYASQRLGMTGFLPSELSRFFRSDTRLEGYLTLFDWPVFETWSLKAVLGAHSRLSVMLPWFGDSVVEASDEDSLQIDGAFVGRAWTSLASYYGTALWENWLELRIPVVPGVISLDGFLDAAALATPDGLLDIAGIQAGTGSYSDGTGLLDLAINNMAFSFGAGLRFTLQQFPFRLYFAKRFYFDDGGGYHWIGGPSDWDFVLSITQPLN